MSLLRYGLLPALAVAALPLLHFQIVTPPWTPPALLPYLLLGASLLLGIYFQLSRIAFSSAAVLMSYAALGLYAEAISGSGLLELALVSLALSIALFSICADRSLYSGFGIFSLLVLLVQAGLFVALYRYHDGRLVHWLNFDIVSLLPPALTEPLHRFGGQLGIADSLLLLALLVALGSAWASPGFVAFGLVAAVALVCSVYLLGASSARVAAVCAGVLLLLLALRTAYELAFRDELTGIPSRRAYSRYLLTLGRHYSIAVVDIDHFKKLNDRYGHQVGDQALRMVAGKIAHFGGGRAFRYGGEEFVVVTRGRDREKAQRALERMREKISDYPLRLRAAPRLKEGNSQSRRRRGQGGGKTIKTSVSVGIAASDRKLKSPDEVMRAADAALYKAKRSGRNRVCVHG